MAETYDRFRPTYPFELFEELFSAAGLAPGAPARIVESGAGTGKATAVFAPAVAAAGWHLTCVEPDPAMAAVLSSRLEAVPALGAEVLLCGFEEYAQRVRAGKAERATLVVAAQSWHWVAPARRAADAAAVCAPGGTLGLVWNVARPHPPELQARLDLAYAGVMPPRRPGAGSGSALLPPSSPQPIGAAVTETVREGYEAELAATGRFGPVSLLVREHVAHYDTASWLSVLSTHSDHRVLEPAVLSALLERVGEAVDSTGGTVEVVYDAVCLAARRLGD